LVTRRLHLHPGKRTHEQESYDHRRCNVKRNGQTEELDHTAFVLPGNKNANQANTQKQGCRHKEGKAGFPIQDDGRETIEAKLVRLEQRGSGSLKNQRKLDRPQNQTRKGAAKAKTRL